MDRSYSIILRLERKNQLGFDDEIAVTTTSNLVLKNEEEDRGDDEGHLPEDEKG